jgi:hypothetical protein
VPSPLPLRRSHTAGVPTHPARAAAVFDAATAFDTALDMVAPPLTLGELLVRHVLLPRELLPPIERHWFRLMSCATEQDFWTLRLEQVMILSRGTSFSAEG